MKKQTRLTAKLSPQAQSMGWAWFAFELLFLPSLLLHWLGKLNFSDAHVNFVYYLLNFLFCARIFRDFLSDSLKRAGKDIVPFLRAIVLGFLGWYLANEGLSRIMSLVAPGFANVNDQHIAAMFARSPVLMAVGTVLLVPVVEETFYRAMIFRMLFDKHPIAAYGLSMVIFSCIHIAGYIGSVDWLTMVLCFIVSQSTEPI